MKLYKKIIAGIVCLGMMIPTTAFAEEAAPNIRLSAGDGQETTVYQYGEEKEFVINIQNVGGGTANNIKISPKLDANTDGWPFEINNEDYSRNGNTLNSSEATPVSYNFKAREDVASKYYKLGFDVTYDDGTKTYSGEKYVFVKMTAKPEEPAPQPTPDNGGGESQNPPSGGAALEAGGVANGDPVMTSGGGGGSSSGSVPRVIVSGFTTEPGEVMAGSNFKLVLHIQNTSKTTAVSNMLFNLSAPTGGKDENTAAVFLPVSGASSIYLDKIPAGATKDISIDLNAKADLIQKPYSIEVAMKYEDQGKSQYEATSSVSVPVKQNPRFEFSEFEVNPNPLEIGAEANVTCNLYNLGRMKLYNVKAKFVGDSVTSKEVFVGNVESGATAAIDAMLTGKKVTKKDEKIKMVLTYEDDSAKVTTVEKELQIEVVEAAQDDAATMAPTEPEKKGLPIIPIVIGLIIVGGVAGGIVFKKKKSKKGAAIEDEFDGLIEDEQ
ncbi:COG1361 S-layer family protein [Lachnospiraceae bacterium LCP25S3_G4]